MLQVRKTEEVGKRDIQYRAPVVINGIPVVIIGLVLLQDSKLRQVLSCRMGRKVFSKSSVDGDLKATLAVEATIEVNA